MNQYHQILIKYWGFSHFKPLQEDVIRSVHEGKDTLVLMPTGGGKSITFQVPAIAEEGTAIVITPLIALMKDQVDRLKKLDIKAVAIYSGMNREEIKIALDNCIYGGYKFLYCSPERVQTELFKVRIENMKVNMIVVDEAHCISQWGYDFRPSYLKIADLRTLLPDVPVLALTASATPGVVHDIQEKLKFNPPNVLKSSFERKNLVYWVNHSEDKQKYLLKLLTSVRESGIVYVRTRKRTKELASLLKQHKISADYYHGGLSTSIRNEKQKRWTNGQCRVIVSTNAFGMGIDKANVRSVIHYDLPDSLEEYYQEAGRAGRDGNKAFAVLLCNDTDIAKAQKRLKDNFPEIKSIKQIYEALGNHFQIPVGSGKNQSFDFNISEFASKYKFNVMTIYNSLKFLQYEGYIEATDEINNPSRVFFTLNRDDLYKFQVSNADFDHFIKLLLRSYTGLFTEYTAIDEDYLAMLAKTNRQAIYEYLKKLSTLNVIHYIPQKRSPLIIYTEERLPVNSLYFSKEHYKERKINYSNKIEAIIQYAKKDNKCRSQLLLSYFGETETKRCGQCDYCQKRNEVGISQYEFDLILKDIKSIIFENDALLTDELIDHIKHDQAKVMKVLQWLLDNHKIKYDDKNKLRWHA